MLTRHERLTRERMAEIYTLYIAVNKCNGKRYVGVTSRSLARRSYEHVWEATKSPRRLQYIFYKAIRFYGADAFDWAELTTAETKEAAFALEVELVALLKPEYNSTAGGEGCGGYLRSEASKAAQSAKMKGRKPPPEAIVKIVAKNTGRKRTPEQRERMGVPRRGKPFSDEHKANLSKARVGKRLTASHRAAISEGLRGGRAP